jgi:hypothetical protein
MPRVNRPVEVDTSTCSVADSNLPPAVSTRSRATAQRSRLRAVRENFHTTMTSTSPASTMPTAVSSFAHQRDRARDPDSSRPSMRSVIT